MATSSRALFALSVVKYVYDVPLLPARYTQIINEKRVAEMEEKAYPSTANAMDIILTVIRKVIILQCKSKSPPKSQNIWVTHDYIAYILHIYMKQSEETQGIAGERINTHHTQIHKAGFNPHKGAPKRAT